MKSIGGRIAFLRGQETRKDFAERLDIPANTLRNYEMGTSLPNSDFISNICTELDVNPSWLLFGLSHGVEYPINSDRAASARPEKNRPKAGNYESVSLHLNIFKAKYTSETVDILQRNIPLYDKICFAYYDNSINYKENFGYDVAVICFKHHVTDYDSLDVYDIYDTNTLRTGTDFFVSHFVPIISYAFKYGVKIYETYTTRDEIHSNIKYFIEEERKEAASIVLFEKMNATFFEKQIETPSILCSFFESTPPDETSEPGEAND